MAQYLIAVVGNPKVGKTSSWTMWAKNVVVEQCTVSYSPHKLVHIGGHELTCEIADLSCTEFTAMRDLIYQKAHGILVLYSVTDPESFSVVEEYMQDINRVRNEVKLPKATFVLWGTKSDLEDERKVTKEQGEELAKQFGIQFMEGSTRNKDQTDAVFMALLQQYVDATPAPTKRRGCLIM